MTEVGSQRSEVTPQRKADTKPMNKKITFLALGFQSLRPAFPPRRSSRRRYLRLGSSEPVPLHPPGSSYGEISVNSAMLRAKT